MTREVDLQALAERVRAARARARMSQADLARAAGVSQATVSRIETGARGVTLAEADALATALDLPLDTLLYGSGVRERVVVALRAAEGQVDRQDAVRPGIELLELDERLDAVMREHRQEDVAPPVRPPAAGTASARGEQLAMDLREALQLGAAPVADLAELVEEVTGVDVATLPLRDISGMCLVDPERTTKLLVVNSTEPAERQRFTLAHELGHLLFGDGAHIDAHDGPSNALEARCNEFARNFLIPREAVKAWLTRHGHTAAPVNEEAISLLAKYFGVATEVVKIQLERMRLRGDVAVPSTPTLATRYGWRSEYDVAQRVAQQPKPPRRLVQRATVAFARGLLGARVLADLQGRTIEQIEAEKDLLTDAAPEAVQRKQPRLVDVDELLALAAPQDG